MALHNPIFLFKNPSGSGKKIQVLAISGNATISNERTLFRLFSNPTVTTMITTSRNIGGARTLQYTGSQPKGVLTILATPLSTGVPFVIKITVSQIVNGGTVIAGSDVGLMDSLSTGANTIKLTFSGKCENLKFGSPGVDGPTFTGSGHGEWTGNCVFGA